jgi:hypothetical protein
VEDVSAFGRHERFQVVVTLVRTAPAGPAEARGDAENMDVHGENVESKSVHHDTLGHFVGDSRQRSQEFVRPRFRPVAQQAQLAGAEMFGDSQQRLLDLPRALPGKTRDLDFAFHGAYWET